MRVAGTKPVRREGAREGRWVLLDFVDVVVHVQHAEERAYYALERLWKDCPTIPFVDSALPAQQAAGQGADRNRQPQVPSGPAYSPDLVMSPFNHVLTSNILDPNSSNMVNAFTNSPIFQGNPFNSEILGFEEDDIAFNLS